MVYIYWLVEMPCAINLNEYEYFTVTFIWEYKKLHTTHIYGMNSPYNYQKLLMDKWMKPNHKITEIQK